MMKVMHVSSRLSRLADAIDGPPKGKGGGGGWKGGGGHHHRPRFRGGFGPWWPRDLYVPMPEFYYGTTEEEVATLLQANECVVLRKQGGPNLLRSIVIDALKARGWEEKVDVIPAGGFNAKIVKLCPPAAESRPVQVQQIRGLGQVNHGIRVLVMDRRGEPAEGIEVSVAASGETEQIAATDKDGSVVFATGPKAGGVIVKAWLPEGESAQAITLAQGYANTVTFRSIRKISGPIVTPLEGVAGGVGVGMILTGVVLGRTLGTVLEAVGGSITIAAAYSLISRHV